ncbi:hypothetical protein GCM10023347_14560 [Streptomyces chumphonensis]
MIIMCILRCAECPDGTGPCPHAPLTPRAGVRPPGAPEKTNGTSRTDDASCRAHRSAPADGG